MATIYDVAERANVSPATISNAFNKPHLIKPATYERILEAARELNYIPNMAAKALAGGKTQMVGVIVSDIRYPFTAVMVRGIEDVLGYDDYISVISSTDANPDKELRLLHQLHRRGVDGFIWVPGHFDTSTAILQSLGALIASEVPVLVAGRAVDTLPVDYVTYLPQAGTKEAVDYLISLGHREIGFIGGYYSHGIGVPRWLGFQESLRANGIPLNDAMIIQTDITSAAGKQAMAQLLDLPAPPTAVFVMNDTLAMGAIDFCYEHNIRIPEQVSMISFDYELIGQRTTPAVTSVVVSPYELGRKAAELFLQRQQQPEAPPQQVNVAYRLAVRQTTAPLLTGGTDGTDGAK